MLVERLLVVLNAYIVFAILYGDGIETKFLRIKVGKKWPEFFKPLPTIADGLIALVVGAFLASPLIFAILGQWWLTMFSYALLILRSAGKNNIGKSFFLTTFLYPLETMVDGLITLVLGMIMSFPAWIWIFIQ